MTERPKVLAPRGKCAEQIMLLLSLTHSNTDLLDRRLRLVGVERVEELRGVVVLAQELLCVFVLWVCMYEVKAASARRRAPTTEAAASDRERMGGRGMLQLLVHPLHSMPTASLSRCATSALPGRGKCVNSF